MDASIYRLRHQDVLLLCVLALLFLGAIMVQSAAMNVTGDVQWQWTQRGTRHLLYAGVAILTFAVVGQISYGQLGRLEGPLWRNPVIWLTVCAIETCVLVLEMGSRDFPRMVVDASVERTTIVL
jgi:cell division protein FtsW (lipid II flippase)